MPITTPYDCPTNVDEGQKEGTGKTAGDRRYSYYDFDLGKIVNVPPVVIPASQAQANLPSWYDEVVQGVSKVLPDFDFFESVWKGLTRFFDRLYFLIMRFA